MFKPGDVVRIKDEACGLYCNPANQRWVRDHGYLWLVRYINNTDIYCTSVATGAEFDEMGSRFYWYASELEKADVQEG